MQSLQIIPTQLLPKYLKQVKISPELFEDLQDAETSTENFSFYTSVSSVYSSKIEGEEIELDSYIKHKNFGVEFLPDYTKKIDDLYNAYQFAQKNHLNKDTILEAHKILTKNILNENQQGVFRTSNMYILTEEGKIEYVASLPNKVATEMKKFFGDLEILISESLTIADTFFYASMLHLVFVKIHPMNDGNGRLARSIEKWFLAEKLGEKAWFLQSEKYYYRHHQKYYQNIRKLGLEYDVLNYGNALDFLKMLPKSVKKYFL